MADFFLTNKCSADELHAHVFIFQYAILFTVVLTIFMKYVLHSIHLHSENPWENKAVYMLYTDLVLGKTGDIWGGDHGVCVFVWSVKDRSAGMFYREASLNSGQNGRHFSNDIFICIFINEKFCILIRISLKFVPKGPVDNKSALV